MTGPPTERKPSAETVKMQAIAEKVVEKMSHRHAATVNLKALPPERLKQKVSRTIAGSTVAIFGISLVGAGVKHEPDPVLWLVMTGLAVVVGGAHVASQDLTKAALGYVVGLARDLVGIFLKRGDPPSASP